MMEIGDDFPGRGSAVPALGDEQTLRRPYRDRDSRDLPLAAMARVSTSRQVYQEKIIVQMLYSFQIMPA